MNHIPRLIYLVGLPGSGKSYYAESLFKRTDNELDKEFSSCVYLSSDALRKEYYGDESCQDNPAFIFEQMRQRTVHELEHGKDVIYDATNVNRKKRIQFLNSLPKNLNCYKICTIVWARLNTCIERDKTRERTVGANVIMKICKQFQTPWKDEGWDEIHIVMNGGEEEYYTHRYFNLDIPHDNPHHPNTIEEHTHNVLKEVEKLKSSLDEYDYNCLQQVALWHDVGKIYTKSFKNSKGEVTEVAHYYDHQNVSAYLYLGRVNLPEEIKLRISYLINMHMEPFFNESRYFKNMDPQLKKLVLTFNECDKRGA